MVFREGGHGPQELQEKSQCGVCGTTEGLVACRNCSRIFCGAHVFYREHDCTGSYWKRK